MVDIFLPDLFSLSRCQLNLSPWSFDSPPQPSDLEDDSVFSPQQELEQILDKIMADLPHIKDINLMLDFIKLNPNLVGYIWFENALNGYTINRHNCPVDLAILAFLIFEDADGKVLTFNDSRRRFDSFLVKYLTRRMYQQYINKRRNLHDMQNIMHVLICEILTIDVIPENIFYIELVFDKICRIYDITQKIDKNCNMFQDILLEAELMQARNFDLGPCYEYFSDRRVPKKHRHICVLASLSLVKQLTTNYRFLIQNLNDYTDEQINSILPPTLEQITKDWYSLIKQIIII